jgi:plastocyanin
VKPGTRDRLVLPILLPLGILVLLGLALWGFSRVLLGVHGSPATAVALVVAAAIVGVSALAASRPQVRASTIGAMVGATAGIAMLAGGIALAVVAGEEEGPEGPGGPGPGALTVVAQDLVFDTDTIELPADTPVTIVFDNRDSVTHNIAIYAEDSLGETLFRGEIITGPDTIEYRIPPLPPGEYYFQCDVHPNMNGRVVVTARGGGEGGGPGEDGGAGPGGGGAVTVVAQNIAFDTDTIELPAEVPTTITFDNRDAGVLHNISIYADDSLQELLFQGELITGPDTIDYHVPPLPAGQDYFHCDVHPNMNGTVVVVGG